MPPDSMRKRTISEGEQRGRDAAVLEEKLFCTGCGWFTGGGDGGGEGSDSQNVVNHG